jgi:preprotein translocase subunit SecA
LVDEADSVLVDDARTPLVIALDGEVSDEEAEFYAWCHGAATSLDPQQDTAFDSGKRTIRLTQLGCRRILGSGRLPRWGAESADRLFHQVEQSLAARLLLRRDRDYIVGADGVNIVDASTGRVAAGRKWRDGLQQAVELKEGLPPTPSTTIAARVTVQCFFRGYAFLAGMTGTAATCGDEFRRVYRLPVATIPTRLPCLRSASPPRIFASSGAKAAAVAAETQARLKRGQAVLIGTPSVEASERLSAALEQHEVDHVVLNCLRHEQEAAIVAEAAQQGRVTIATNMAGRGTDIAVSPAVLAAGGLHVIATEMQASSRIDRQLVGRTARQGDPGSYQFFLSLDDELLAACEDRAFLRAKRTAQKSPHAELPSNWLYWFRRAQRHAEMLHRRERRELLRLERERQKICRDSGLDALLESVE